MGRIWPFALSNPEQPSISTSAGRGAAPSGRLRCAVKFVVPSSEVKFTISSAAAAVAITDSASAIIGLGKNESDIARPYHGARRRGSGVDAGAARLPKPVSRIRVAAQILPRHGAEIK